jgi:tight adherence protein B
MTPIMVPLIVFLAVTGLVGSVAFLIRGRETTKAVERLDFLLKRGSVSDASLPELNLQEALASNDTKNLLDALIPKGWDIGKMLEQADLNIKPAGLVGLSLTFGVGGGLVGLFLVNWYVAPVFFAISGVLPYIFVVFKKNGRMKRLQSQLPDAMELVARALRAGHSLAAGMHVVAEEMPDPISKEFRRIYDEQNMGIAIEDSLKAMCERIPNLDLKFFSTSVAIQRQTGGDLAEILDRIGYVIRERFKILGQVKALTAEGRLSGIVLIALPIGLFLMMLVMKPDYIELLWKDPTGIKMSIGAIVLMIIGAYAIQKIIDIKV